MNQIYFDNGATAFPKAPGVAEAMAHYILNVGASVNRSSYEKSQDVAMVVLGVREKLCQLFNFPHADHVILTSGHTAGLNQLLFGLLSPGDRILTTSMEHNAVARPLHQLEKQGVTYTKMPCDEYGYVNLKLMESCIQPNTKAMIVNHGSNVSGAIQDLESLGKICKKRGIFLLVDGAQTAGHCPIDMKKYHISALSVPTHKGLLSAPGIGVLLLEKDLAKAINPAVFGGTGSISHSLEMPDYMPDKFEPGTPNLPGLYGLDAALDFLGEIGLESIQAHHHALTSLFVENVEKISHLQILGNFEKPHISVVSLNFLDQDNGEVADRLDQEFGILTRCGLHCAPWAHQTLGTFPAGSVRFSFGLFNTEEEILQAVDAVRKICGQIDYVN
ncbi:MAG: aminotransferase class V-fold PLP-dependent enzyme [Eubacteriales bacterium]